MVATTQLRLALETEEERRANGLDLIWIEIGFFKIQRMSPLALYFSSIRYKFLGTYEE